MRYPPTLSLSFVVLAPSTAAAQQATPLAGAARPHLRVLQNLPEAQLFPLMNLVRATDPESGRSATFRDLGPQVDASRGVVGLLFRAGDLR